MNRGVAGGVVLPGCARPPEHPGGSAPGGGAGRLASRVVDHRIASRWLILILSLSLTMVPALVLGADFRVKEVETRVEDGTYLLNARIDYRLTPEVLEALENGVPLVMLVHVQVRRSDAWIWEESVLDLQLRYTIRHRPLSDTYEVFRLPGTKGRSFVTREAAIAALGEIRDLHLIDQDRLAPDEAHEVQIKAALDIEELPLPLRPMAYLRPSWNLASGWTKWPLQP